MVCPKVVLSILTIAGLFPASAIAETPGVFAGLDVSIGRASGSSDTTNGGGLGGGGAVHDVDFGNTVGVGGHVGYRITPTLSAFISYQHVRGDVSWKASFASLGGASAFGGKAASNTILGNAAYDFPLSDATYLRTSAGLGLAFNSLSGIVETDIGTGQFGSNVGDDTQISPAAQAAVGLRYRLSQNTILGVDAAVTYVGNFKTGSTRRGNLGITPINPYELNDVWRASLGASIQFEF